MANIARAQLDELIRLSQNGVVFALGRVVEEQQEARPILGDTFHVHLTFASKYGDQTLE